MKRNVLIGCSFAFALFVGACGEQTTEPEAAPVTQPADAAVLSDLGRSAASLLSGLQLSHAPTDYFDRAINPDDYACGPTRLDAWIDEELAPILSDPTELAIVLELLNDWDAANLPFYESVYLTDPTVTPQEFGYDGEYTNVMERTDRDIRRFWNIDSDEIQLIAMKGDLLLDVDRVAQVYVEVYGIAPATAQQFAERVVELMNASKTLNGGDHLLFVFNAFAVAVQPGVPDPKIVMGDATLAFYETLGLDRVAAQGVYAHEFAHHIQFANGYFDDLGDVTAAEATRYTELMADAMSAYYLTHKRGAAMNKHRVAEFFEVFFEIGDCGFDSGGHHGTPNQRMAAAEWGFALADEAQKQGHILTAEEFHALFVEAFPALVAPDAS